MDRVDPKSVIAAVSLDTVDGTGRTLAAEVSSGGGGGGVGVALGSGVFGKVGTYRYHGAAVAVKELKAGADEESIGASVLNLCFVLTSAPCMRPPRGRPPCRPENEVEISLAIRPGGNVVLVYGFCFDAPDGKVRIVLELCAHGSLRSHLRSLPRDKVHRGWPIECSIRVYWAVADVCVQRS